MLTMEQLLRQMYARGASDLLLTAGTPPQARVNGLLTPLDFPVLDPDTLKKLAVSVLNEEQVARLHADKSLDLSMGVEGLSRFRFNIYFQRNTLAIAVRMIPFAIPSFEALCLPEVLKDFSARSNGLLLVTGPAGSGKSTTLAAMIDYINQTRHVHVVCIEDPIEYLHTHRRSVIDQREVMEDTHTFADALRGVFRQSPDVIMVGEMRDLETTQLVMTLAETGHLILATLHTQDATHAINRVVDMYPADQQSQIYSQLSLVLLGVMSQQLVVSPDGARRVLAYELMNVNNAIRNLIREAQLQQIYSVIQTSRAENMVTMNDSLRALVDRRLIDAKAALTKSPRPKELARLLKIA